MAVRGNLSGTNMNMDSKYNILNYKEHEKNSVLFMHETLPLTDL